LIPTFVVLLALAAGAIYFVRPDLIERFLVSKPTGATVEELPKETVISSEEVFRSMAAELGEVTEEESARRAFNALAEFWNVFPVPESDRLAQWNEMEQAAQDRKLRLYRFSGNLGALLRIDYPAALELNMPDLSGKRYISLVGIENEQVLVAPTLASRQSLSFSEIERHWSGRGFLLWKDPLNLLGNGSPILPGVKGAHIKQLQSLLRETGMYSKALTGVFDGETLSAVKAFQLSRGIEEDGIVGGQTLMILYRSVERFKVPKLVAGPK
jgi:general secretion pathway protein A